MNAHNHAGSKPSPEEEINAIDNLSNEAAARKDPNRRFGREIAYGVQQTFACWVTDFIDPPISKFLQNTFGNKQHHVTDTHTFGGEFIGDSAAFGIYLGAKRFLQKPIDGVISGVKKSFNATFTKMGKSAIEPWAQAHHVDENSERYKRKLEEYKDFQAENIVDSAIISASATGVNVLAQRYLGNKQSYMTILGSKVVGATLTLGLMAGLRVMLPSSTKALDDELSDRYFSKAIRATKKALGVKDEVEPVITKSEAGQHPGEVSSLSPEKREGLLIMVAEHAMKIDWKDPAKRAELLAKQRSVYEAFETALADNSKFVKAMAHEHYEELVRAHNQSFEGTAADSHLRDEDASIKSIQASAAHKRRDMQQFIALLDDKEFLAEVDKVVASGKLPERRNTSITQEQKDYMSDSLLKYSGAHNGDIADTAEAQALDYKALAHALSPEGYAARTLASELKRLLPTYDPKDVDGIAKDYMGYYQQEALSMVRELDEHSPVVTRATERAQHLKMKYQPPAEAHLSIAT